MEIKKDRSSSDMLVTLVPSRPARATTDDKTPAQGKAAPARRKKAVPATAKQATSAAQKLGTPAAS